ncbi:tetratricopeptide repeat protein [Methylophaga thalassica]|uniref:tetratricopeptide repeat protein n=1 Tax=Methylophaga aminisulfidivorans TaxID=230105 RepID=UPI0024E226DC|nr:tetratricopeptide repeat protein [Methylophaga aminisulfidivorans]
MKKNAPLRPLSQAEIQPIINALNSGQLAMAEAMSKKLLKQFPNAFVLHNLYGNALAGQNKTKEAVEAFRKAIKIDPSIAEMHFNLAALLTNMNRHEEAIQSYKKAVSLKPNLVDAYYNMGIAHQALKQYPQASQNYQKAIELEPGFYEAMVNLGVVLQEQGMLIEAINTYNQALQIHNDAQIYFNLGTAYKNQGKLGDAIAAYNKALELNPNYADVHRSVGEVLRDQGRYDESVAAYKRALELNPDLPMANYSLAVYLYDSGDLEGALEHFQRSQYADWQERSLYCLYKTEQFEEFKSGLDALKRSKDNSPFLATLAGHYAENFGTENDYNFCKNPLDFVFHTEIPELKNNSEFLNQLLQDIDTCDVDEKSQGRLYNGVQSSGNLFKRPEASFRQLAEYVAQAVERYRQTFAGENCQFVKAFPKTTEFASSWYVRMKSGGHLTSHIHEEGWVSGSLYLSLPKNKQHEHEGSIELSTHGDDYPKKHDNFPTKTIAPEVGDLVMFPSSCFHRTIPFSSDEERICIAFDLKPV